MRKIIATIACTMAHGPMSDHEHFHESMTITVHTESGIVQPVTMFEGQLVMPTLTEWLSEYYLTGPCHGWVSKYYGETGFVMSLEVIEFDFDS